MSRVDADGTDVGTVTLSPEDGGTRVEAEVEGLEPGFHGFHVHDVGLCEADRYTSSEADAPGPDDMTNSTGDAGGRIACGVIEAAGT